MGGLCRCWGSGGGTRWGTGRAGGGRRASPERPFRGGSGRPWWRGRLSSRKSGGWASLSRCGVTLFCLSLSGRGLRGSELLSWRIGAVESVVSTNEASRIALEPWKKPLAGPGQGGFLPATGVPTFQGHLWRSAFLQPPSQHPGSIQTAPSTTSFPVAIQRDANPHPKMPPVRFSDFPTDQPLTTSLPRDTRRSPRRRRRRRARRSSPFTASSAKRATPG